MAFFESMGASAASNFMNTLSNVATAPYYSWLNLKEAEVNRQANYAVNEKAADNADTRTRKLYNDLYSPKAQMQQIEEAGLSPSIYASGGIAGKSGSTGAQGAGGAGMSGGSAHQIGANADIAQTELALAQARKANAEADTEEGKNQRGSAEIDKILAEVGATEARTALDNSQKALNNVTLQIQEQTKGATIHRIEMEARKADHESWTAYYEAKSAGVEFDVTSATAKERIEQAKTNTLILSKQLILTNEQIKLTQEQRHKICAEIAQEWDRVWQTDDIITMQKDQFEKNLAFLKEKLERETDVSTKNAIISAISHLLAAGAGATVMACAKGKGAGTGGIGNPVGYPTQGTVKWNY